MVYQILRSAQNDKECFWRLFTGSSIKGGTMFKRISITGLVIARVFLTSIAHAAAVPMVGDKAPDFTLTSVTGEKETLSQHKGSIVVLGLFHICEPCMNQATEMQKLLNEGSTKAVFVGVNTDGNTKDEIVDYLGQFQTKITFQYMVDPAKTVNK